MKKLLVYLPLAIALTAGGPQTAAVGVGYGGYARTTQICGELATTPCTTDAPQATADEANVCHATAWSISVGAKEYTRPIRGIAFEDTYQKAVAEALSECQRAGGRDCFIDKVTCYQLNETIPTQAQAVDDPGSETRPPAAD